MTFEEKVAMCCTCVFLEAQGIWAHKVKPGFVVRTPTPHSLDLSALWLTTKKELHAVIDTNGRLFSVHSQKGLHLDITHEDLQFMRVHTTLIE